MTKQNQYNDYTSNGGSMTMDQWEKDGRYDSKSDPKVKYLSQLLKLHIRCVDAIRNAQKGDQDPQIKTAAITECAEAESALLQFYDETESFKVKIEPQFQ